MRRASLLLLAGLATLSAPLSAQTAHGHNHGAAHGQMTLIPDDETAAIKGLLMAMFDRPDAPLSVQPVVVEGNVALAGWQQDARGGRALLRRGQAGWFVALCAGPELLDPAFVQGQGLDTVAASRLIATMRDAEASFPGMSSLLDTFDTVLVFDEPSGAAHGHGHSHGH